MNKYLIIAVCSLMSQTAFSSQTGKTLNIIVTHIAPRQNTQQMVCLYSNQTVAELVSRLSKDHPVSVGIRISKKDHWRYEGLVDTQQTLADVLHKYPKGEFYSIRRKTQVHEFSIGAGDTL